jgi:hypothetical protein
MGEHSVTVMIGIPSVGHIDPEWITTYHALQKPQKAGGTPDWVEAFVMRDVISRARNLLVETLLNPQHVAKHNAVQNERNELIPASHSADWLFFLDDDILPQPDVLLRMLSHNVPIVSGLYVSRLPPHSPVAYRQVRPDGEPDRYLPVGRIASGLQEVDATGAGCLLVKREVFERMRSAGVPWFQYICDTDLSRYVSEDIYFCEQARKLGYPILLDSKAQCGHIGRKVLTLRDVIALPQPGGAPLGFSAEHVRLAKEVRPWPRLTAREPEVVKRKHEA